MFKKKKSGLTLLEVVIAVALLAILLLPLMRSFVTSAKVNQRSREIMIATDVAQSLMEGISGKSYISVLKGMDICASGGFDFTKDNIASSGAFAFSSIDNNFYNSGYAASEVTGHIEGVTVKEKNTGVDLEGVELDQAVAAKAIETLQTNINDTAPILPDSGERIWNGDKTSTENKISSDQCWFYGTSSDTYSGDSNPKVAYMMYCGLEKDNHYYDAIITFTPAARNVNVGDSGSDEYFAYRVRIAMYEYDYDDYNGASDWPSRFDGTKLEGSPTAVLETGIQYK